MAIRRNDSFLWGKTLLKLPKAEGRPGDAVHTHKCELLDDIQKLRLEINHILPAVSQRPDPQQQDKNLARNRIFFSGKKKFNMDPKSGVDYLVRKGMLEWRAEAVAEFLYKEEGLNKTAIGNFLGDREKMHLQVLKAFVGLHEFSDLNLVQALRQFLWSFRLPGEAQKIDRMMEAFAARYCDCNPGVFQSTDTCYILSFAIIMLNTSLHNPNVKHKPNLQHFVSMNRGINNGDDLPVELLTKLYASIRSEPFKIPEDDGNDLTLTFFNPDREGWLLKMGGRVKTWKRRWFILTDSCLYYFEYTTDKDPIGIIPLENLLVRDAQYTGKPGWMSRGFTQCIALSTWARWFHIGMNGVNPPHCLELYNPKGQKIKACKTENKGRVVQGKHHSYKLSAAGADERDDWIRAIRASITKDPFYDLVTLRKRKVTRGAPS